VAGVEAGAVDDSGGAALTAGAVMTGATMTGASDPAAGATVGALATATDADADADGRFNR
jgi:hypothetical protein